MIKINTRDKTYVCPFCGHGQAFAFSSHVVGNGHYGNSEPIPKPYQESSFHIYSLMCSNDSCKKISVTAINRTTNNQVDIVPKVVFKHYPEYIPPQILQDYYEANLILEESPKAAATLLRRCLQGMIHDFWDIHEKNLNAEITRLKNKIDGALWKAIDGIRSVGNIGAHMEADVNTIVDIEPNEAKKLLLLIELLLEKWYVARHDEEQLYNDICNMADVKEKERASD